MWMMGFILCLGFYFRVDLLMCSEMVYLLGHWVKNLMGLDKQIGVGSHKSARIDPTYSYHIGIHLSNHKVPPHPLFILQPHHIPHILSHIYFLLYSLIFSDLFFFLVIFFVSFRLSIITCLLILKELMPILEGLL